MLINTAFKGRKEFLHKLFMDNIIMELKTPPSAPLAF